MSLYNYLVQHEARERANMQVEGFGGLFMAGLAKGVTDKLQLEIADMQKQKEEKRAQKDKIEQLKVKNKFTAEKSFYDLQKESAKYGFEPANNRKDLIKQISTGAAEDRELKRKKDIRDEEHLQQRKKETNISERRQDLKELTTSLNKIGQFSTSFSDAEIEEIVDDPELRSDLPFSADDIWAMQLNGRAEPYYIGEEENREKRWRVLSDKEFQTKIDTGVIKPTELEHMQLISAENRAWNDVYDTMEQLGITKKEQIAQFMDGIQWEEVMGPMGFVSIPARVKWTRQFMNEPRYHALAQRIEEAFNAYRKRITGVQAGMQEISWLRSVKPLLSNNPAQFFASLENQIAITETQFNDRVQLYENAGRDVSKFKGILETRYQRDRVTETPYDPETSDGVIDARRLRRIKKQEEAAHDYENWTDYNESDYEDVSIDDILKSKDLRTWSDDDFLEEMREQRRKIKGR
jgi:hypothetical protein